ncbi:MAG: glycosyltransferase family 2 protein, partial [Bacteroidia bacterium]
MKLAGFTIIRNALKYDYPVIEAITSILPICDRFYVGVGNSGDETRKLIESIGSDKIEIIDTIWNDSLREGGLVLSDETNKVFDKIPVEYDWCFYIQSDECVHENDLDKIKEACVKYKNDKNVDGLLFNYKHFYGQYNYIGVGRR